MARSILIIFCVLFVGTSLGLDDYTGTEMKKCIDCLCHAVSGCWSRFNCANYSVTFDYWKKAKSPVISTGDDPDSEISYQKCMSNENCIVGTIVKYTNGFGEIDCNCDGDFDCKDRLALHLFGAKCQNPNFTPWRAKMFNECAAAVGVRQMLEQEGKEECGDNYVL